MRVRFAASMFQWFHIDFLAFMRGIRTLEMEMSSFIFILHQLGPIKFKSKTFY